MPFFSSAPFRHRGRPVAVHGDYLKTAECLAAPENTCLRSAFAQAALRILRDISTDETYTFLSRPDTVLTDDQDAGSMIAFGLDECRIRTVDTFHRDRPEAQRKKIAFWMGDARVKVTTLHSFKGWETRLLIVHITRAFTPNAKGLIYAGLTRLKRDVKGSWLTVICSDPLLAEYGCTWPDYLDRRAKGQRTTILQCRTKPKTEPRHCRLSSSWLAVDTLLRSGTMS